VLLGVNMQTSFMHPPFGFALFYLRSVAARVPYLDKITGKKIEPITTGQIYWGAVPFVIIQVLMIGLTIAFPQMVMRYKDDVVHHDIKEIHIQVPGLGGDGMGFNPFAAPGSDNTQAPGLGGTPPGLGGTPPGLGGGTGAPQPATPPPATHLSQPPKFN
jgi:hypothetical protein